jgi:hypothetical protein
LIRRWGRFRRWTDEEDRQFKVYIRLLEDCDRWEEATRSDEYLSTGEMLRRYEDAGLPEALQDRDRVERFARLRAMDRDGQRLSTAAVVALEFLKASQGNRDKRAQAREQALEQQRADRERAAQAKRDADVAQEKTKRVEVAIGMGAVFLAILALFAFAEYFLAKKERTSHRSYMLAAETGLSFQPQFRDFDEMNLPLRNTLVGAHFFDVAGNLSTGPAGWPLLQLFYRGRLQGLHNTEMFSEARINASIREVLLGAPWMVRSSGPITGTPSTECAQVSTGGKDLKSEVKGARFYPRSPSAKDKGLVVAKDNSTNTISVYVGAARHVEKNTTCQIDKQLISTPPDQPVKVGVPTDLSNLIFAFSGYSQFYTISWDDPTGVETKFRGVVAVDLQQSMDNEEPIIDLASTRSDFATDVKWGDTTFRLFDLEPTRDFESANMGAPLTKANDKIFAPRL